MIHHKKQCNWILILIILITLPWLESEANNWEPPENNRPSVKLGIVGGTLGMQLSDLEGLSKQKINYNPNVSGQWSLGVEYSGLSASMATNLNPTPQLLNQYGRTKADDYQLRILNEKNTYEVFFQRYEGFYVGNSRQLDSSIGSNDPFFQFSKLHMEHYGFQYFRTINPDQFSMGACFDQSGWQKVSGATWFLYSGYDFHHIDSGGPPIIPDPAINSFASLMDFEKGDFQTFKLGGGGAFAWVFGNFLLGGQLIYAGGQQQKIIQFSSGEIRKQSPTSSANLKVSISYNGPTFFTGAQVFQDTTSINIKDRQLTFSTNEVRWMSGIHF